MPPTGGHLAVHIGTVWAGAVVRVAGQRIPVTVDGFPRTPSGVFLDPDTGVMVPGWPGLHAATTRPDRYLTDPLSRLAAPASAEGTDPADLVAVVLGYLAGHAAAQTGTPITALSVAVPPGWGPRRRQRLHDAALRAGLPAPRQVTAPAALAAHTTAPGDGACVLVCHAQASGPPTLSVLQATDGQYRELATSAVDVPPIERALAERVYHPDTNTNTDGERAGAGPGWQVLLSARQAHEHLAVQDRAPILLPEPHPPAILHRDDLTAAVQPLIDTLPGAVQTLLAAADVDPQQLRQVIYAAEVLLPGVDHALAAATGLPITYAPGTPAAVAACTLAIPGADQTAPVTAATAHLPRVRLRLTDILGPLAIGACSLAMLVQAITTADVNRIAGVLYDVRAATEQFAVAAALIALAALAAAHLAPTTWLTGPPTGTPAESTTGDILRRAYLAATAVGTATAGLYALAAGTALDLAYTPYLRWCLLAATPALATGLLLAAVAPRIPAEHLPTWLHHTRPAALPVVAATAGMWLMYAGLHISTPANLTGHPILLGSIGAATLGVATALTATRQRLLRAVTAPILALGYAAVYTVATAEIFTIGYICALAWWSTTLAAHTIRHAFPHATATLRRLVGGPAN